VNSTYFGLLAEFGEANIPLERVAPKYFGLSYEEARRRAPAKMLPCPAFRLGGQKSPWLVSAADLAELIDARREKAAVQAPRWPDAHAGATRPAPRAV
jgi:Pyocin activator protein PrtN